MDMDLFEDLLEEKILNMLETPGLTGHKEYALVVYEELRKMIKIYRGIIGNDEIFENELNEFSKVFL